MNQNEIILNHLRKNKGITSMDAFELYGITRLSARIHDLRESGYQISMIWEYSTNQYGNQVRYGKYFLIKNK